MKYKVTDTPTPENKCLDCGATLDMVANFHGELPVPREGHTLLTICMVCGHIMAFDDKLKFRPLTDEEIIDVAGDVKLLFVQEIRKKWLELKAVKQLEKAIKDSIGRK